MRYRRVFRIKEGGSEIARVLDMDLDVFPYPPRGFVSRGPWYASGRGAVVRVEAIIVRARELVRARRRKEAGR